MFGLYSSPTFFWRHHLYFPLMMLVGLTVVVQSLGVDAKLALWLYRAENYHWALRNHWITSGLLHTGGKEFSWLCAIFLLAAVCASFFNAALAPYRRPMLYIFFTAIVSAVLVGLLKMSLAVSCPWEFDVFGGNMPYSPLWQQLWLRNGSGCFPAGHASAGYSWLGLYFVGHFYQSRWRWAGLGIALVMGILFGGAQQLRGAHFITHDLWTLAVCWFCALSLFTVFFRRYNITHERIN